MKTPSAPEPKLHVPATKTAVTYKADFGQEILLRQLNRQFSAHAIGMLGTSERGLDTLRVGEIANAVVVLSDIQNFSTIVRATHHSEIKETLAAYYRLARELVWLRGGILDKFIGDAVLAVFEYPFDDPKGPINAIQLGCDLVTLGQSIFGRLRANMNEDIPTGTRVGISSGQLTVLDIGYSELEISFVGNPINLAARLQKASEVDGVLIDQRTAAKLPEDGGGIDKSRMKAITIPRSEAKGQMADIRGWQLPPVMVCEIGEQSQKSSSTN